MKNSLSGHLVSLLRGRADGRRGSRGRASGWRGRWVARWCQRQARAIGCAKLWHDLVLPALTLFRVWDSDSGFRGSGIVSKSKVKT